MDSEKKLNFLVGLAALILLASLAVFYAVRPLLKVEPDEPARVYVAYFDDAAGIAAGDSVRIQNRRAGVVRDAQLVHRNDRMQVRVEFEISPGASSPWLKDMAIPADSRISVQKPRMFGRPRLTISIGDDDEGIIEEGGEWTRTRSARTEDELQIWEADRRRFEQNARDLFRFFENEKLVDEIKGAVAEVHATLREAEKAAARATPDGEALARQIGEVDKALGEFSRSVEKGRKALGDGLDGAAEGIEKADNALASAAEQLGALSRAIDSFAANVERANVQVGRDGLDRQVFRLRRDSARLRAGWERAMYDPSRGGNMESWRRSRHYIHGGESQTDFGGWATNNARRTELQKRGVGD